MCHELTTHPQIFSKILIEELNLSSNPLHAP